MEAAAGHEEAGAADHRRMLLGGELYLALPEFDLPVDVLSRLQFPDTPLVSSRDAGSGNYISFPYVRKWLPRG